MKDNKLVERDAQTTTKLFDNRSLKVDYRTLEPIIEKDMTEFYEIFLKWRNDAGMNNGIADDLPDLMKEIEMVDNEKINSDEHYEKHRDDFNAKVGIWSKVAGSKQMVEEGYLNDNLRLKAIEEYDEWIENKAISMTMKLNEVRGKTKPVSSQSWGV